jgi:hypothetical protein
MMVSTTGQSSRDRPREKDCDSLTTHLIPGAMIHVHAAPARNSKRCRGVPDGVLPQGWGS